MKLKFADKPAGVTTHTSLNASDKKHALVDRNDGFVEWLADQTQEPLFVVHRLDKETTGTICFAQDAETAEKLRLAFETRQVSKRYLFLTNKSSKETEFRVESHIERDGAEFISHHDKPINAITQFKHLESSDGLHLWEAKPESGRPHQIRLHAQDHGIAILGDSKHGGSLFPALCLHSESLEFDGYSHKTPPPVWFTNRALAKDQRLTRWLAAIDRRERLGLTNEDTARLIHTEGDPLRIEKLGDVLSLNWFRETEPNNDEWNSIRSLIAHLGFAKWHLQMRGNRGKQPLEERVFIENVEPTWVAKEKGLSFEFRTESGLSPGLFLDQRRNREWVRANASDKDVLNLFSYTCGFSVAAAAAPASKVASVDVSRTFLEWGKRNFALNDLDITPHEFRAMDSREYLAWAAKKSLLFDIVICDPPSFSRSKSGLFQIEKDFAALLKSLLAVLAPKGTLLFSNNFEKWDLAQIESRVREVIGSDRSLSLRASPSPYLDFELPRSGSNMKSFMITRQ